MELRGIAAIRSGKPPRIPVKTGKDGKVFDFNKGGWCSAFATRAAEKIFGLLYERANAWLLADRNSLVWSALKKEPNIKGYFLPDTSLSDFERFLRPGRILGVFYGWSHNNAEARLKGRPYTHAMLYLGKFKGNYWVVHNVGGPRIDILEKALNVGKTPGIVADIIQPKNQKPAPG